MGGACSSNVKYSDDGVVLRDTPVLIPGPAEVKQVGIWGIHCNTGGNGAPFSGCEFRWQDDVAHAGMPLGLLCKTVGGGAWTLQREPYCVRGGGETGVHAGAGPGGECRIAGVYEGISSQTKITMPMGTLDADTVANGGWVTPYCTKGLPPSMTCEISVPNDGVIDHGVMERTGTTERHTPFSVNCGGSVKLSVLPDSLLEPAPGVVMELSASLTDSMNGVLDTRVTTNAAKAGDYQGIWSIIVGPF